MKGTLDRTLKGWVVKYFDFDKSRDIMYCGESLPLHPEDVSLSIAYSDYSTDWIGKEVEFEIINESWEGYMGGTYAKLVSKEVKGGESETFKEDDIELDMFAKYGVKEIQKGNKTYKVKQPKK